MSLPDGFLTRTLTVDNFDEVVAMVNECELHDAGERMWERADLLSDASTDGFDLGRDWIGVWQDDRVVGWGLLVRGRSAWVDVHPTARGRGIGTWLRRWSVVRAREKGADRVGQTIDDRRTDVASMFLDAGYTPRHTSWILRIDHREPPAPPEPPAGARLRAWRADDTDEAFAMFEDAFAE